MRQGMILLGLAVAASITHADAGPGHSEENEAMIARGTFEVEVTPQPPDAAAGPFQRLLLAKKLSGDLEGASEGQMLGAYSPVEGSGGYVALELVTGVLHGKKGTFMLQHNGTMRKESYRTDVSVVPDSGTGELTGIAGTMKIIIEGKKHSYELEYTLED